MIFSMKKWKRKYADNELGKNKRKEITAYICRYSGGCAGKHWRGIAAAAYHAFTADLKYVCSICSGAGADRSNHPFGNTESDERVRLISLIKQR